MQKEFSSLPKKLKMFNGRNILIATNHGKEKVISPILAQNFGIESLTIEGLNTDILGTFSGEIERKEDPISTLRQKCLLGLKNTNLDLAIASEGSFGAHPSLFFAQANDELVMLLDTKNKIEIVARELSTETNFAVQTIKNEAELIEFAERVQFPSHGIIIRTAEKDYSKIYKGITKWEDLKFHFDEIKKENGTAYIETDMRALFNPTRMKNIEKATAKLIEKMKSCCPNCQTPGFGISEAIPGLPCEWCGKPTASVLKYRLNCKKCSYLEEKLYPNNKTVESPEFCDNCNP
jgi:hypothetical protein